MVFDPRHAETPNPMELFRMSGENSMLWTAEPWADTPSAAADETLDRILSGLRKDPNAGWKVAAIEDASGVRKSAIYQKLGAAVHRGIVRKEGNVFFIADGDNL